jgi:hypothetical protein
VVQSKCMECRDPRGKVQDTRIVECWCGKHVEVASVSVVQPAVVLWDRLEGTSTSTSNLLKQN